MNTDPNKVDIPSTQQVYTGPVGGAVTTSGQIINSNGNAGTANVNDVPISSSTLSSNSTPLTVPTPTSTGNPAAAIISTAQANADAQKQAEVNVANETASLQPLQDQRTGILDTIKGYFGKVSDAQTAAQTNPQLDQATKDLTDINKTIADVTVAYRGEKDAAMGNGSITKEGQQSLLGNIETKYGRQLADLAIRQSAASNNITALQTAADRKLALTIAPLQTQISYLKDFALANNDTLTQQEKDKINQIITEKNRLIDQNVNAQKIANDAFKAVSDVGGRVPDAAVQEILANPSSAWQILSKYGVSTAKPEKLTDAFGNEYLARPGGGTIGINGAGGGTPTFGTGQNGTPNAGTVGTGPNKLSFEQYGLLANTDFNPSNQVDSLAQKYLDQYLKNGTVPTSSTLGRNIKSGAMAQIDSRARDLYFKATGTPLPNPEVIKANQDILAKNLQLANNLKVQEQTVSANVDFSIANMKKNDLNSAGFKPLSAAINSVEDMFNNPATGQLIAQNSTIQNELGSLLAVKNASGTTVYDKLSSAGIITSSDSPEQVKSKVTALLTEAANFADSLKSANADIYRQIDPLMQDANNPLRQQQIDSKFIDQTLSEKGMSYQDVISKIPAGEIGVITKDGQIGHIPPSEFDPAKYTKL